MQLIKNNSYLLLIIVLCMIFTIVGINKLEQEVTYEHLVVAEGDTLWDYSIQYANKVPSDKWIKEIMKMNNLSSTTIQVGDRIRIPTTVPQFDRSNIATNTTVEEEGAVE